MRDISRSYKKLWVISTTLFISLLLLSLTFSIKQSMNEEIQANSKELLGGDIQISSGIEPLSAKTLEKLSQLGQISEMIELGTMLAKQGETPVFTQLRAVDSQYPLYGVMQTTPKDAAQQLFLSEAIPIVLINENIQNQLQLNVGDDVTIMGQNFVVGGLISSVPDIAQSAVFGEFAIINSGTGTGADDGKLYYYNGSTWVFLTDLSAGVNIVGPKGEQGIKEKMTYCNIDDLQLLNN